MVRIRMYSIGFGDCFLLEFPRRQFVLVDCGVHMHSKVKRTQEVVEHIRDTTGGELAVVIATHAHADHISGFGSERDTFKTFQVGEVWLPWLEDVSRPEVKKMHAKLAALTGLVRARLAAEPDELTEALLVNAVGSLGADGGTPNEKAMSLLRGGFGDKKRVHYLKAGDQFTNAGGIRGLTVRVLAPSEDTSFISRMNPPAAQQYKLDENGGYVEDTLEPFPPNWRTSEGPLSQSDMDELTKLAQLDAGGLALTVDHYLNNTSLALLLTYGGKTMLFPGDAQWGSWQSWQDEWDAILDDVCVYKVGHHGSHNATPSGALERMTHKSLVALASTDYVKRFREANHPVPYPKLVEQVRAMTNAVYAQSDELDDLPEKFERGEFWCDYEL